MKKRVSLYKKIKLYLQYRRVILNNIEELEKSLNLRVDGVNRLYTVINIPETLFGEPYNLRTSDIYRISEPYIAEYLKRISNYLNDKGLSELFKRYSLTKVDKYSYLLVIGFSLFDTDKMAKNILFKVLPTLGIISMAALIAFKLI